jgi:hypothetical protein
MALIVGETLFVRYDEFSPLNGRYGEKFIRLINRFLTKKIIHV